MARRSNPPGLPLLLASAVVLLLPPATWAFDYSYSSYQQQQEQYQGGAANRAVYLSQVQALTLHKGRLTTGRRSSPVPQLKCLSGCEYEPEVVQCKNVGSDGRDVQWKCEADLPTHLRFGTTTVSCEGYDYPEDPRVLEGSCGLEYSIQRVSGSNGGRQGNEYGSGSSIGSFIKWAVIIYIVYMAFRICASSGTGADRGVPRAGGGGGGGGGWWPPSPPPPPPPGNDYKQSAPQAGLDPWLTGAAGMGLGYMFGQNTGYNRRPGWGQSYYPGGGNGGWGGGSASGSGSSTRTASAYASTSRR